MQNVTETNKMVPSRECVMNSASEDRIFNLNQGQKDSYGGFLANRTPIYYICPFLPHAPTY